MGITVFPSPTTSSGGGGACPTCLYTSTCLWTPHADGTVIFHVIGGGSCGWSAGDRTAAGGAGGYSNKCIDVTTSDCYCITVGAMCGDTIACNVVGTTMCIKGGGRSGPCCSCGALGSGGDINYQGGCGMCYFTGSTRCFSAQGGSVGIYAAGRDGLCSNEDINLYCNFYFSTVLKNGCPYLTQLPWNIPNSPMIPSKCTSIGWEKTQTVGMPRYHLQLRGSEQQMTERVCMGWFTGGNANCGSASCPSTGQYCCAIHAGCGGGGGARDSVNGCGGKGIAFVEYVSVG
tara:strand:+ start:901 stop:1764 length:864 start_codon:yes stop_codon:yes gene_type:complete